MSWNGAGVFNRIYSWTADKAAGIDITASRMDTDTNDITTNGFGNCLTRDGQGSATANLPMNTFRHTGVGNGINRNDYAALGQVQDGIGINWTTDSGVADALAATYTPAITALVDGQLCFVRAANANATTTPTFAPNGLTAHTITEIGGAALVPGAIRANQELILRYNLSNTRWELLNPPAPNIGWVAAGGTADAITATYSPAVTSLYDGLLCWFRASAANATTTPTFSPNGLTAHTITRSGGSAVQARDIPAAAAEVIIRYNLANTRWELLNPARTGVSQPSRQIFTSGSSATYTTPTGASQLRIRMVGGGGGGGGSGNSTSGGGNGGATTFNSINANAGTGGGASASGGGAGTGGSGGSGGSGGASLRIAGAVGAPGNGTQSLSAGGGGAQAAFFGGAGAGGTNGQGGGNATANTGSGGGGAGSGTGTAPSAAGGGAGEYVELIINAPAATYTYTVGAGGAAGGGTTGGGTGAAGQIIVDETYF